MKTRVVSYDITLSMNGGVPSGPTDVFSFEQSTTSRNSKKMNKSGNNRFIDHLLEYVSPLGKHNPVSDYMQFPRIVKEKPALLAVRNQ